LSTGKLPFECDFEKDFCELKQRVNDDIDWLRRDNSTTSDGTGPLGAKSGRWYIYLKSNSSRDEGDKA